ncbi:MAG: hypothetical protein IGR76_13750 [Synechococcales cyanobacterium T60_A2020_003]|nr:hypothetical protein [Synechococcales cyanobacterium T60_A2020_003]
MQALSSFLLVRSLLSYSTLIRNLKMTVRYAALTALYFKNGRSLLSTIGDFLSTSQQSRVGITKEVTDLDYGLECDSASPRLRQRFLGSKERSLLREICDFLCESNTPLLG